MNSSNKELAKLVTAKALDQTEKGEANIWNDQGGKHGLSPETKKNSEETPQKTFRANETICSENIAEELNKKLKTGMVIEIDDKKVSKKILQVKLIAQHMGLTKTHKNYPKYKDWWNVKILKGNSEFRVGQEKAINFLEINNYKIIS